MAALAPPALYALFVWWFSTGAILVLDRLPQRSFRWSMGGATLVLAGAAYGLVVSRTDVSTSGAYLAFTSGLLIWAWLEMTYYMGFVTGPRREPCAEGCSGWRHFGHAVMSSLYHELATIGLAAAIYFATSGMPNRTGLWTFVILWGMQISAKLNVFLGVPNVSEEFLPQHLSFLRSFLTRKPMNLLFPLSVTASIVLATLLVQAAYLAPAGSFEATGGALLATLVVSAVLEHWFLVLPLRAEALWAWSLVSRDKTPPAASDTKPILGDPTPCASHAHPLTRRRGWSIRPCADKPLFQKPLAAGVLVEAGISQPSQPSMARRPS